jgi:hypothetical protein
MSLILTGYISLDSTFKDDVTSFLLLDFRMCTQRIFYLYNNWKKADSASSKCFFSIHLLTCVY